MSDPSHKGDKFMKLEFTEYELNLILNALAARPFREVVDLINKIVTFRDEIVKESQNKTE